MFKRYLTNYVNEVKDLNGAIFCGGKQFLPSYNRYKEKLKLLTTIGKGMYTLLYLTVSPFSLLMFLLVLLIIPFMTIATVMGCAIHFILNFVIATPVYHLILLVVNVASKPFFKKVFTSVKKVFVKEETNG